MRTTLSLQGKLRLALCLLAAFAAPVEGPGSSTITRLTSKTVRSIRYATSSVDRMTHQSDQGYPKAPAGA